MKTKMIVLFLLSFDVVSANHVVSTQRKNVSCREIQTEGGYFYKMYPCTEGEVIIEQKKHVIGRAISGKFSSTDVVILTNESGIVTKYCENTLIEFHDCNETPVARMEYYPTNDTSNNGAPGTSSQPNVTHPVANNTLKYGAPGASSQPNVTHPIANNTLKYVVLSIGMVGVLVALVFVMEPWKCMRRRKPENHEGNNTAMQPLKAVTVANQAAQA